MKVFEIESNYKTLSELANKKLPASVAMSIAMNMQKLVDVIKNQDKVRADIVMQYAKKDDEGKPIITHSDNGDAYQFEGENASIVNEELVSLMMKDVEVTLDKITKEDIKKCFDDRYDILTANDILALAFMTEGE